ncbi:MAG: DUF5082 domain-containing protein [Bacillus sp. (in: firmicutes)]
MDMSSITALMELLRVKKDQLRRLLICQANLNQSQSSFFANEYLCMEPKLTPTSWEGSLANEFNWLRESGILTNYQEIETTQFNDVFRMLNDTIRRVELEIQLIEQQIAALQEAERKRAAKANK